MLKKLFHNWFDKSRRIEIRAGNFNHCSSVCAHKNGVLIAWYSGTGECRDDQSVYVAFINGDQQSTPLRIGDKTGNPVLIPTENDNAAMILWSRFEDIGRMRNIVERWKYCSLHIMVVNHTNGRVGLRGSAKQIAPPEQHMLGRCNPIAYDDQLLLPLYDEANRQGVIFKGHGFDFEFAGRIGENMIQPTLWVGENNRIHSLSRNFMTNEHFRARHSYSDDGGETWSVPEPTVIPNRNSSLHAIRWNGLNLLLWNDTPQMQRKNITLGVIEGTDIKPVAVIDDYGAYPSMCVDGQNDLHMTYTSSQRTIIHHTWNYRHFKNLTRRI
jgi:hypothetical protein